MSFRPIRYDSGRLCQLPLAVSQTITKGMGLKWSSGYLTVIETGSYQDTRFVAMEDVTTSDSQHTLITVIPTDPDIQFEAGCSHVVSVVDRGTYADIATSGTIDPDGSTYNDFYVTDIVGAAETSTTVLGYFTHTIA
ncbi:MAG: hypothetical protein WC451_06145 [Patescibacteria group bacterium]